jgi:hypothetical protein
MRSLSECAVRVGRVIVLAGAAAGRIAMRLASGVVGLTMAQRRAMVLYLAWDRQLAEPDRPPETYREFLLRASGPLLHEPSARARRAGRLVG